MLTEQERERHKRWERAHPEKIAECNKRWRKRYRRDWHRWLSSNGYGVPSLAMLYHHKNPKTKLFKIGRWIGGHSVSLQNIKILLKELKKCSYITKGEHSKIHNSKK